MRPYHAPDSDQFLLRQWRGGLDTLAIARRMSELGGCIMPESMVYGRLHRILDREAARRARLQEAADD